MIVKPQGKADPVREENGRPIIQIELDKSPDEHWKRWLYINSEGTTSLMPQDCRISGTTLEFHSDYSKAEEHIQLVLKWIEAANKGSEQSEAQRKELLERRTKQKETEQERLTKLRDRLKQI